MSIYHYCLMTNHVHLVGCPSRANALRPFMQRLNLLYAKYLRRTYGHVGHVWQDRFKSLFVADDAHLLQCGAYIELNPVRAKVVPTPAAYSWSSYRAYANGTADPLVTFSPAYLALDANLVGCQRRYREFVERQLQPLPSNWFQQRVLGSVESLAALREGSDFQVLPRSRGRPKKSLLRETELTAATQYSKDKK